MKNKKLFELSKKITENKLQGMNENSVKTIKGGKLPLELAADCTSQNSCWGFGGTATCSGNSCWSYN
ncbi:ecotin [Chryseobacterium sp. S0630]|uniref:hypothetical protein n=1 Tax=unclassified Chryseobacterium TaxID=2593645 RepID=UPI0005591C70|nr:hypothetical protein [Chryseobacterium sp. S0630]MCP1298211.1 ecotin [Chryseobacterium sp. S0630]